jgi:hypothetical protein
MIEDPERRKNSGLHGFMMAYAMLEPKKGWEYLTDLVHDREQPFLVRFAGLQTIRFLYDKRSDIFGKDEKAARNEIVKGVSGVLNVVDMADFAIEDLRAWKRWECSGQVLGLWGKKEYQARPIIRKAILRYALQCPSEAAKTFVTAQRKLDPEWVDETRELLELETIPAPPPPPTKDARDTSPHKR